MPLAVHPGEVVVYRKYKTSLHPGQHAREIHPAQHGDSYSYAVEKYWRVIDVAPGGQILVRTRRGKERVVAANDPNLRRVHWWERLLAWRRFPPRVAELTV